MLPGGRLCIAHLELFELLVADGKGDVGLLLLGDTFKRVVPLDGAMLLWLLLRGLRRRLGCYGGRVRLRLGCSVVSGFGVSAEEVGAWRCLVVGRGQPSASATKVVSVARVVPCAACDIAVVSRAVEGARSVEAL